MSDTSSVASCSELVAAIEALKVDLQLQREREFEDQTLQEGVEKEMTLNTEQSSDPARSASGGSGGEGRISPVKSLSGVTQAQRKNLAEEEKILDDCNNTIKVKLATNAKINILTLVMQK